MEKIAVLGSTGSIGTSGLDVISRFPDRFRVCALSANTNVELLQKQAKIYKPEAVCITGPSPHIRGVRTARGKNFLRKILGK